MRIFIVILTLLLSFTSTAKQLDNGLYAELKTNKGDIILKLNFEKTPLTVINFVGLATGTKKNSIRDNKPFYDGLKFHRVIDKFMIQGGDPKGNGTGGPGYKFNDEITDLTHHKAGILSMANSGPNTNGSQFFITTVPTPWLDGKHSVFGVVVSGLDIVNNIKQDDVINKVNIIRIGDKAKNFKTDENAFQTQINKYKKARSIEKLKELKNLENFVKTNYPKFKIDENGYYTKITKNSDKKLNTKKAKTNDKVKVKLSGKLNNGLAITKPSDPPYSFVIGSNSVIPAIEKSVIGMSIGEPKSIILAYQQIYGDLVIPSLKKDTIFIFDLELIAIE